MATKKTADLFDHEALIDFEEPASRRRRRFEAERDRNVRSAAPQQPATGYSDAGSPR